MVRQSGRRLPCLLLGRAWPAAGRNNLHFLLRSKALMGVVAPGAIQGFCRLYNFFSCIYLYIHELGPWKRVGPALIDKFKLI